MKILRIAGDLYPATVGGAALHAHNMSIRQAGQGHEVTVFTAGKDGLPDVETIDGYGVRRFRSPIKLYGNPVMPSLFLRLAAENGRFDIVHAHSHLYIATNVCALVRLFSDTPLVITNHGLTSQTAPTWLNRLYLVTLGRWTFNAADRVICYTEEEKGAMEKLGVDGGKIRVIHNGIDTDLFRPADKVGAGDRLLWIGRFVPGKGVEYLVDAFAEAINVRPGLSLTMVGQGPQLDGIKEKIRGLGLDQAIRIVEFVPNEALPDVYRDADIFLLSSLAEGVPRTLLEAMACGLPVICTGLPQLKRIVHGCGLTVPPGDSHTLAKAIQMLVSNPGLAHELGVGGRERVQKNYSWDDTVQKTLLLYGDIIESRRSYRYESERSHAHPSRRTV